MVHRNHAREGPQKGPLLFSEDAWWSEKSLHDTQESSRASSITSWHRCRLAPNGQTQPARGSEMSDRH